MNYHETCNHCGHRITAYTLPMNASMANAFARFAEKYAMLKRGLKKGEIGITNSQYSNFQNLRHFGIIEQDDRGQAWHLTRLGFLFYEGTMPVMSPAGFINGTTLRDDHGAWGSHAQKRRNVFIGDILPERFKQRSEYREEAAEPTVTPLF